MYSPKFARVFVAVAAMGLVSSGLARTNCGRNATPSYRDITTIRYYASDCHGNCPIYEVLFSPTYRVASVSRSVDSSSQFWFYPGHVAAWKFC